MTPTEAQRQIDHASNRVSGLEDALRQARRNLAETVSRVGLVVLGLERGDVIVLHGRRYSVTGARHRHGGTDPIARLIKKDGTIGEGEMPEWCLGWERENAD